MKTSSSLDEWRDHLRNMNFWLEGYRYTRTYEYSLPSKILHGPPVYWNVGVGPAASFSRAVSSITPEAFSNYNFDHVIKVELKPTPTPIEYQLAAAVAEELGLLDQEYSWRNKHSDEYWSYTYGGKGPVGLASYVENIVAAGINEKLSKKRYVLMVENLYGPIERRIFSDVMGIPPPTRWSGSRWFISTTSRDVFEKSKSGGEFYYQI